MVQPEKRPFVTPLGEPFKPCIADHSKYSRRYQAVIKVIWVEIFGFIKKFKRGIDQKGDQKI